MSVCRVIDLKLPCSIMERLQELPLNEDYHCIGKTVQDEEVSLIGKYLDGKYLTLHISDMKGFRNVNNTVVCHIRDAHSHSPRIQASTESHGTLESGTGGQSEATTVPHYTNQPHMAAVPEQSSLIASPVNTRKSSRLNQKYGEGHSVLKRLKARTTTNEHCLTTKTPHKGVQGPSKTVSPRRMNKQTVQADSGENMTSISSNTTIHASDPTNKNNGAGSDSQIQNSAPQDPDPRDLAHTGGRSNTEGRRRGARRRRVNRESGPQLGPLGTGAATAPQPLEGVQDSSLHTVKATGASASQSGDIRAGVVEALGGVEALDGVEDLNDVEELDGVDEELGEDLIEETTRSFQCYICDYTTDSTIEFDNHFETSHENFLLSERGSIKHEGNTITCNSMHDKPTYPCKLCAYRFKALHGLLRHLRKKHADHPKSKMQTRAILEHRWSKVTTSTPHSCLFCGKRYFGQRILTHMKHSHVEEPSYQEYFQITLKTLGKDRYLRKQAGHLSLKSCPHCGKQIKQCSLRRHVKNHCTVNEAVRKRYHCHLCTFFSYDSEECRRHKASAHTEQREFICETCAKTFTNLSSLTLHNRAKHGIVKRKPLTIRTCPECGKTFERKSSFDRHLLTHNKYSAGRPHVCSVCGKGFKDKSGLTSHVRTVHEGCYRFHCEQCGHGFRRQCYKASHQCGRTRRKPEPSGGDSTCEQSTVPVADQPSDNVLHVQITGAMATAGAIPDSQVSDMVIIQTGSSGNFVLGEGGDSMYVVLDGGSGQLDPVQSAQTLDDLAGSGFDDVEQSSVYEVVEAMDHMTAFPE